MNYNEINELATEIVDSFASMEASNKWDQFLNMQMELTKTPLHQLLPTPEYIAVIFAGHIRFNDAPYVQQLRDAIDWPESCLEAQLEMLIDRQATSIAASKLTTWRDLKEKYPSHAAMSVFVVHSLSHNRLTKTFLNNLRQ